MPARLARARFLARAAAAALLAPARTGAQSAIPLRIAIAPSDGVTSVVYAKSAGLFERAGFDAHIDIQSNGAAVAAAIASGSYDVGNSSVTSVFLAHEKGLPFVLVAPAGIYDARTPFTGALVLKSSPIRLDKDAEGATVGVVSLSGMGHDATCAWVEQHGGNPALIRFVEVPFSAAAEALAQHRIVAAESATPAMTNALDRGDLRVIPVYNAIAATFLISAWFMSTEYTAKHPDVARAFARVVAAAAGYANAHHAETAPIMAQFTGIPLDVMLRMPRALQGTTLVPALIQPGIAAAAKYGLLKKAFPAEEIIFG